MSINTERKQEVMKEFRRSDNDSGSTEVQVALLTSRIRHLTEHLKTHIHDNHTRFGLVKMVSARRRLLDYLRKSSTARYRELIAKLGLRR